MTTAAPSAWGDPWRDTIRDPETGKIWQVSNYWCLVCVWPLTEPADINRGTHDGCNLTT